MFNGRTNTCMCWYLWIKRDVFAVAWLNDDVGIAINPLHFPSVVPCPHIERVMVMHKPHSGGNRSARVAKRNKIDVLMC